MARPMLLIKRELLEKLWYKHAEGVGISKLISIHNLPLTPPTLTKLILYVCKADEAATDEIGKIITDSLYPRWLEEAKEDVVKQCSDWRYEGKMPLGKWVENTWAEK